MYYDSMLVSVSMLLAEWPKNYPYSQGVLNFEETLREVTPHCQIQALWSEYGASVRKSVLACDKYYQLLTMT